MNGTVDELKLLLPQCLLKDQLRIGWPLAAWLRKNRDPLAEPPKLDSWLDQARASVELRQLRQERLPAIDYPPELPISTKHDEIVAAIRKHQVLVIAGETGSGQNDPDSQNVPGSRIWRSPPKLAAPSPVA